MRMRRERASVREERGATIVEFALSMGVFFVLILFTVECALLGYRSLTVQYVASRTAREGLLSGSTTTGIRNVAVSIAGPLGFELDPVDNVQVCHDNQVDPDTGACDCTYTPPTWRSRCKRMQHRRKG